MTLDLQTMVLVLTGAVVPLIIYLLSRGPQLRQLRTSEDTNLVTSATALVTSLQNEVAALNAKIERLERDRSTDRADYVAQLNRAHDENQRLATMVAQLRTDTDIATRQIDALRSLPPTRDGDT
jgi:outer membrane murein-binding lipoprotein Lpp